MAKLPAAASNAPVSKRMKSIKREDTLPELAVRRMLHACGLRYSLHRADLPGRPDIVLPARGTVVFVHGCFWHGHACAHGSIASKSNAAFWAAKIETNRQRDRRKALELRQLGWQVETVWECQTARQRIMRALARRLKRRGPDSSASPSRGRHRPVGIGAHPAFELSCLRRPRRPRRSSG